MSVSMVTPVRAETFKNLQFNAGIMFRNLEYATAKDAESLVEMMDGEIESNSDKLLGATKGGINPQTNFTFWEPELDGKRMSFVGSKQLDNAEVKISGTLVEFTPTIVRDVLGLADESSDGEYVKIVQPRFDIEDGDYIGHIVWISNLGSDGLYVVDLSNALSVNGLSTQSTDKNIGTLPFEFVGHAASVGSKELPIKYLFYKSKNAQKLSAPNGAQMHVDKE